MVIHPSPEKSNELVDIDIKGFFDSLHHSKFLKKI